MTAFPRWPGLSDWERFLLAILVTNSFLSPVFWTIGNQVSLIQISVEKAIVVLIMTLVIINGEIDLSVASIMGLAACTFGWLHDLGLAAQHAVLVTLAVGAVAGAFNAFWIAVIGLPSLVVTLGDAGGLPRHGADTA